MTTNPTNAPSPNNATDTGAAEGGTKKVKKEASSSKKRKRSTSKKKKDPTTPAGLKTPPPSSILIIDNGGDTLKYGWAKSDGDPQSMPNVTGRLRYQINVLCGDEIDTVKPNQLESTTRSMERGYICNMGNQIQVWKRLLDKLRIGIPTNGEASQVFGWKIGRNAAAPLMQSKDIAVLLLVKPHCPRVLLDQMLQVWMEDLGVSHVGFAVSSACAAFNQQGPYGCCCVVDAGWSATNVVPTYKAKVLSTGIKHVPLGGRHLLNMWKYYVSYRQWNLMDQEWILRDVQHRLAFFSMEFSNDMKLARKVPLGKRPWDRDYVLPDMQTTYQGEIRLAAGLQMSIEENQSTDREVPVEESNDKSSQDGDDDEDDNNDDESNSDDEEEETEEEIRHRVLRQRQEEERRRREMEAERQVLAVSLERFTIPEVLFRPSDAGMPKEMAGLPQAIVQSIEACPRKYQAALFGNVFVTGGVAQIPNFQVRLERELRMIAPTQYQVKVTLSDTPVNQAWLGAREWVQKTPYNQWSVSRDEWEKSNKDSKKSRCWHRLLVANGGALL